MASRGLRALASVASVCTLVSSGFGAPAPQEAPQLEWIPGPAVGALGDLAEVRIPEGYVFADAQNTRTLLTLMENPVSGTELGTLSPASDEENWFVFFEFAETGYIADDEEELDADELLDAIRAGNRAGNEERRRRGWSTIEITGWQQPPRYNQRTNLLEWAIRGQGDGGPIVNWNTRLLGRRGVMEVGLVCDPTELEAVLPEFEQLLAGFSFREGHRYAEFRAGDRVAEYGLKGLVLGGGLAVAAKSGLLGKLWKVIVVGALAVAAFFRKLFGRISGGGRSEAGASDRE